MKPPTSPFPPRVSPYADEAEGEVRSYLRGSGLLRSQAAREYYDSSRLGYLTAQIYPDALRSRLLLLARWFGVWTIFDDQLEKLPDERPAAGVDLVAEAMMSLLRSGILRAGFDESPFFRAFAEAWAGIAARSSRAWQQRFLVHTRQYLAGCRQEADNRRSATVPDLPSYIRLRRRFGGIRMAMDLSEFSRGYALSSHVHGYPAVQEMLDVLGDITLWGNDVFSFRVDEEEGNVSNLLLVLCEQQGCSVDEAGRIVLGMLDERLQRLHAVEHDIRSWCAAIGIDHRSRADIECFIEGVHTWISGNIAWSMENARYRTAKPRVGDGQPNFLLALVPPEIQ